MCHSLSSNGRKQPQKNHIWIQFSVGMEFFNSGRPVNGFVVHIYVYPHDGQRLHVWTFKISWIIQDSSKKLLGCFELTVQLRRKDMYVYFSNNFCLLIVSTQNYVLDVADEKKITKFAKECQIVRFHEKFVLRISDLLNFVKVVFFLCVHFCGRKRFTINT